MHPSGLHYFPLPLPFLLLLLAILIAAGALLELHILRYAYERMGIHPRAVMVILFLSFLGSYVNIPLAHLAPQQVVSDQVVDFFGMRYVIPAVHEWPGTVIAINVGGALIPLFLSIYLVARNGMLARTFIAIGVVTLVVHALAHPVRGVGISVPIFIPPVVAALIAMILSPTRAPVLAYVAGTMGTLIGADVLNLGRIQALHAPVASIGGAGTFDGVFLTGIIAVMLPPVFRPRRRRLPPEEPTAPRI